MKCERCGWDFNHPSQLPEPKLEGWKLPPLPEFKPHPIGLCPSPFATGDVIYWNLAGRNDDLPPIRGRFTRLTKFIGPDYDLNDGVWREKKPARPISGLIGVDGSTVSLAHINLIGAQLRKEWRCFPVELDDCVLITHWPMVTCG